MNERYPRPVRPAGLCGPLPARLIFLAATLSAALIAQTPADATPPAASDDTEVTIELSPFVVSVADDRGYLATSSLAGTRIRSDLRNLANSITVVTETFMRDINATDPKSLLVYTGNTEAGGVAGNYSGATGTPAIHTGVIRQPQNNNRVRGLARADLTRDYFPTTMVFDSYNTTRVEINRGPNATLFGLGSPGGIINNQLIQPTMKNSARTEFNYGSHDTYRAVLDIDRVLIPGRLGLRLAALHEKENFQQRFAFDKDTRLYAAARFTPWENATLRASFEKGQVDANRPRANSPRDVLTRWWDPAFNKITHSPATAEFNTINRDLLRAPGEWFEQPALVYESNLASTPARMMIAWNQLVGIPRVPGGNPSQGFQANIVSLTTGSQWYSSPTAAALGIKYGSFYSDEEIGDVGIFDWRNQLLDGPNKREWEDFQVTNAGFDQTWKHRLGSVGFEAAANRETFERSFYDLFPGGRGYNINIDVNTTLPWGDPNPNFGRPFIASSNQRTTNNAVRTTQRLTTYLELDFARNTNRLKWLGRHNITGYLNRYSLDEKDFTGQNSADVGWTQAVRAFVNPATARDDINSVDGLVRTAVYIGPSLANLSSPQGIQLQGLQTKLQAGKVTGWHWDRTQLKFVTREVDIFDMLDDEVFHSRTTAATLSRQKIDSQAVIHQAHLLPDEMLVGTLGWRKDRVRDYRNNGGSNTRDQYNFVDRNDPDFVLPEAPGSTFEDTIFSYGVVLHQPRFIRLPWGARFSVHYNRAENFQPADARIDIYGRPIDPPGGETEDRGFSVSCLDDRVQARFNWYQTDSARATMSFSNTLIEIDSRVVMYNTPAALAAAGWQGPPDFLKQLVNWQEVQSPSAPSGVSVSFQRPGNMQDTQSTSSKGFEFEGVYNPTKNWRIALNVSRQQAQRSDIAPVTQEYLQLRIDEWTTGATGNLISDESGQVLRLRVYDRLLNGLNADLAREGQSVSELREWRANLITNYAFDRASRLRGWSVGGAARWQDDVAIGYPIITVPADGGGTINIPDLARPYRGPTEMRYDAWVGYGRRIWRDRVNWSIQLNVRNVLDRDDLIPVLAQPDGSIASWYAPAGRTFNVRTSFEF